MIEKSKLIPIYEQHLEIEKDNKVLEKYVTLLKKKIDIKQVDNVQVNNQIFQDIKILLYYKLIITLFICLKNRIHLKK